MANDSSIQYISDLLDHPESITDGDQGSILLYRQTFPYFIPARYMEALESHKSDPFSPAMLSSVQSYTGNWILFCKFLEAGTKKNGEKKAGAVVREQPVFNSVPSQPFRPEQLRVTDKKKAEPKPGGNVENNAPPLNVPIPNVPEAEANAQLPNTVIPDETVTPPEIPKQAPVVGTVPLQEVPAQEAQPVNVPTPNIPEPEAKVEVTEAPEAEVPAPMAVAPEVSAAAVPVTTPDVVAAPVVAPPIVATPVQEAPKEVPVITAKVDIPVPESLKELPVESKVNETSAAVPDPAVKITAKPDRKEEKPLIQPVYTGDYFLQQGEKVAESIPQEIAQKKAAPLTAEEKDKALMVMMSFSEWLLHFKNTSEKHQEEKKEQKALKTMWQKEKLAAAIEEENEEIPENVFEMAVNSITKEDGLASESLADIYIKQGKYDKAIEMYRKLSLRNPQKSAYFVRKIEEVLKEKQS